MAVSTKIIKRRIRSIGNTKKITKAMEMVSAAKMRKAVQRTLASRSYAGSAWELVVRLAERTDTRKHPLLAKHVPIKKIAVVTVSSNRGLCGSFNANIAKEALGIRTEGLSIDYMTIGEKAANEIRRAGASIVADFKKQDVTTSATEVSPLVSMIVGEFLKGTYDQVYIAFTDFESSLRQSPRLRQLLPFKQFPDTRAMRRAGLTIADVAGEQTYEYLFEPNAGLVLDQLLPRLIELQVYQAVLESDASEHSARMLAMRNATDAAGEMIGELTLAFNQARQAGITQEIAEISGGKAALEH